MERPGPLSKTSIGSFVTCRWLWYAYYILKRKRAIGLPAMNGINAHDLVRQVICEDLALPEAMNRADNSEVRDIITLTNSWWPLYDLRSLYKSGSLMVEEQIFATKTGKRVKTKRSALVTGIVDLAEERDGVGHIDDWKSGNWEKDDPMERNIYAGVIGPAMFPECKKIIFTLRFMKTGNILRSTYQFSETSKTAIVTDPTGEVTVQTAEINPFLKELQKIADEIEAVEPIPNHGKHCKQMFGAPCQFYADLTCPYWQKKMKKEE